MNIESLIIPGVKQKVYIAICGIPDCGKSTFIKTLVQYITKRFVDIDSFCNEQVLDRTIRSSQIVLRHENFPVDYVFLDCPGHIDEYPEEVESCISKCNFVIFINDENRLNESKDYYDRLHKQLFLKYLIDSNKIIQLFSHSKNCTDVFHYDAINSNIDKFKDIMTYIYEVASRFNFPSINPVDTAINIINETVSNSANKYNIAAMCSFGKDSLVMLQLFKMCGVLDKIKVEFPLSGFDLPGINKEFIERVEDFFGIKIEPFKVIRDGWTFENHSVQEMMLCKAEMLNQRILEKNYKFVFTGIRRDEEGTRAKEKFFSPRKLDGSFDCYQSQLEIYGFEYLTPKDILDNLNSNINHFRVNPLLDLTESDIWYITKHFNIPICSEYISKNGYRYRSLGDWPITTPIESNAKTIDEICEEVSISLIPERACRAKQDKSVQYGMEKLRTKGFF